MAKYRVPREPVVQPLDPSYKIIPLTRGQFAFVDSVKYDFLMQWNWYAVFNCKTQSFYARRSYVHGEEYLMHHVIFGYRVKYLDHKNRNTLDNRQANLRPCSVSSNNANGRLRVTNSSGYRGVSWQVSLQKWRACISKNRRTTHIGLFDDKIEAAKAWDAVAILVHGEFANLNFPESKMGHCAGLAQ